MLNRNADIEDKKKIEINKQQDFIKIIRDHFEAVQHFASIINQPVYDYHTILATVISAGELDLIPTLISMGADVNASVCGSFDDTALHHAVRMREHALSAVNALLKHHPDINAQNGWGETPLYVALVFASIDYREKRHEIRAAVIERLLKENADIYATSKKSTTTPLQYATALRYQHETRKSFELMINAALINPGEALIKTLNLDEKRTSRYTEYSAGKTLRRVFAGMFTNWQNLRNSLTTDKTSLYRTAYLTGTTGLFSKGANKAEARSSTKRKWDLS